MAEKQAEMSYQTCVEQTAKQLQDRSLGLDMPMIVLLKDNEGDNTDVADVVAGALLLALETSVQLLEAEQRQIYWWLEGAVKFLFTRCPVPEHTFAGLARLCCMEEHTLPGFLREQRPRPALLTPELLETAIGTSLEQRGLLMDGGQLQQNAEDLLRTKNHTAGFTNDTVDTCHQEAGEGADE